MDEKRDKDRREVVSKEEFDRRVKAAAWDEMDRLPYPTHQWMFGSLLHHRHIDPPRDMLKVNELEEKLRRMEEEREQGIYGPKQSRWWHAFWPFGR